MPKLTPGQEYEMVGVDALRPHPKNPRRGDVQAIHASIDANGFYGAIVAQKKTGHILAGNHRWMAAKAAQMALVPVIWVDVDDERALKILLADNRTNDLAGYDDSALTEILAELANTSDLSGTGYDEDDLEELVSKIAVPDFQPASEEEQVRLDQKKPCTCPNCGHEFTPT